MQTERGRMEKDRDERERAERERVSLLLETQARSHTVVLTASMHTSIFGPNPNELKPQKRIEAYCGHVDDTKSTHFNVIT